MASHVSETSRRARYAILAECLELEADRETDEVLRAWRRYEAAVLRDLGRRSPKSRAACSFDQGVYELTQLRLEELFREADESELDIDDFERLVLDNFGDGVKPYVARFLDDVRSWRSDTGKLKEAIGNRLLWVIEDSDSPADVMDQLAAEAEQRGLIQFSSDPRRESPLAFVMDLWWENPVTQDRVNLNADRLDPLKINDLSSALDAIL